MAEKGGKGAVAAAGPGRAPAVARLVHAVVCEEGGMPLAPPDPSAPCVLEALRDGRSVGGLLLDPERDCARVSWWAVERSERGAGLGRQLLKQAEEWCVANGIARLSVRAFVSVPSAVRLLWTCGFAVASLDVAEVGGRSLEILWFEKAVSARAPARRGR